MLGSVGIVDAETRGAGLCANVAASVGVAALALAAYAGLSGHSFLLNWDDLEYVVENEAIRGLSWANLRAIFTRPYLANYAPLHILSYAVDHALWGLRPAGFLLTNVVLHAVNGILLYSLLARLGTARAAAALGAAFFVASPVQVESVAWISERKNVLCMTFFLLAVHAFVAYRSPASRHRAIAYLLGLASGIAALLTKAAAVVLAPVLLLFDFCYVDVKARRHWLVDKLPIAVATAAVVAATVATQGEAIAAGQAAFALDGPTRVYTMAPVVVRYLGMVAWPFGLSPVYMPRVREVPDLAFWAAALVLLGAVALGVLLLRRRRKLFFWYATFFVGLVPVLQIIPLPTLMNDRYLYFPMLGASGFLALALEPLVTSARRAIRVGAVALGAAGVLALAMASHTRADVWRDDVSLWRDATAKVPKATLAWNGLGMSLVDAGRGVEALGAFQAALALDPDYRLALNNIGALYNRLGQPEAGRPYLLRAVALSPGNFGALMNLGIGYQMSGDWRTAAQAFHAAVALRPWDAAATSRLREAEVRAAAQ